MSKDSFGSGIENTKISGSSRSFLLGKNRKQTDAFFDIASVQ